MNLDVFVHNLKGLLGRSDNKRFLSQCELSERLENGCRCRRRRCRQRRRRCFLFLAIKKKPPKPLVLPESRRRVERTDGLTVGQRSPLSDTH